MMQAPTIGRKVWYWCGVDQDENDLVIAEAQAFDATVIYVNNNNNYVTLAVIAHDGTPFTVENVQLFDPGTITMEHNVNDEAAATWMPYQKAQHDKQEKA